MKNYIIHDAVKETTNQRVPKIVLSSAHSHEAQQMTLKYFNIYAYFALNLKYSVSI